MILEVGVLGDARDLDTFGVIQDAAEELGRDLEGAPRLPVGPQGAQHARQAEHGVQVTLQPDRGECGARQMGPEDAVGPEEEPFLGDPVGGRQLLRRGEEAHRALWLQRARREIAERRRRRAEDPHRLGEARVDLGLGECLGRTGHHGWPHLDEDLGIALREVRELPLLVADRGGQHVVRRPRRLGHGRLDHDEQLEPLAGLAPARGVRIREEGVRALDDERPQALRMVEQDLLGDERRGEHREVAERGDGRDARRERPLGLPRAPGLGNQDGLEEDVAARPPDVPRQREEHADQVGDERREGGLLDTEVVEDGGRLGLGEGGGGLDDGGRLEAAAPRHLLDVHRRERLGEAREVPSLLADEPLVDQPAPDDRRREAEEQVGVRARPDAQMAVRAACGLGLARVDDHERVARILDEALEGLGGVVAAVRDARVGAEDEEEARVPLVGVEVGGRRGVEHPLVHQAVLGLLLREGVEPASRAEGAEEAEAVWGVHVVALAADADEADRARRVLRADRREPRRDLRDRDVPGDRLEAAVGQAAERLRHPLGVAHVARDAEALVADVAGGDRVPLVGADRDDPAAGHVHPHPAVLAAEHADGREVGGVERERRPGDGGIDGLGCDHRSSSLGRCGRAFHSLRSAGPGRTCMSRAPTGSPHSGQASVGMIRRPHPRCTSSTGGPSRPAIQRSPQRVSETTTG